MAEVELRNIVKRYGSVEVVKDLSLQIKDSEFLVLVGSSGCGKSTTLRMIAGLEEPDSGEIWIGGKKIDGLPPRDRDIAMVFQNYALYPHLTVFDNIAFSLQLRKIPKNEIQSRVYRAAEVLGIESLLKRRPKELSGGQRQRVALARALVRQPQVFLLDEPLSNLDAKLRAQTRTELKRLHQQIRSTFVYVTHDQVEAMTMGDTIAVMRDGVIVQLGNPKDVYEFPVNRFVAGFIGSPAMNFLPGALVDLSDGTATVRIGDQTLAFPARGIERFRNGEVLLGIRPEAIGLKGTKGEAELAATIEVIEPSGSRTYLHLRCEGHPLVAEVETAAVPLLRPGSRMTCSIKINQLHVFDPQTEDTVLSTARLQAVRC
ncbi:MAG: ABC transporter ATP-binding protein [Bacteroidota bacterium]